ncbi:biliverdin-producing heme oxygenase [Celeribacter persicus]|uniref:Heme oxygenase n=1 Tax=Celeribacter persicus TaxID=1651082 RepID=A0A2T5GZ73_9RHOB|nr:biliverdin-producing heme oxygenase [Celeribacter persicus]PTQ64623.1 heme oxygenase [Celeribacter persicus]
MNTQTSISALSTLSARLRAETNTTHERLDRSIMEAKPFDNIENYGRFLRVQHGLHHHVAPLYRSADLAAYFPGLNTRGRLSDVAQDMADLDLPRPEITAAPATETVDLPEALGWLYVVEGSNLGAAFLLKYAKKMGLSEAHGARHLAEPPEGRAPYWRAVKSALDAVELSPPEQALAIKGAAAAFATTRDLVRTHL